MKSLIAILIMSALCLTAQAAEPGEAQAKGGRVLVAEDSSIYITIDGFNAETVQDVLEVFGMALNVSTPINPDLNVLVPMLTNSEASLFIRGITIVSSYQLRLNLGDEKYQQLLDAVNEASELKPNIQLSVW